MGVFFSTFINFYLNFCIDIASVKFIHFISEYKKFNVFSSFGIFAGFFSFAIHKTVLFFHSQNMK